jgi:molybdopterin synthase catalytic subunit
MFLPGLDTILCVSSHLRPDNRSANDWVALTDQVLDVGTAYDWALHPSCGAVVVFSGTVRDHADGRDNVSHLTYEAYEDKAIARMNEIVAEARRQWPAIVKVAMLHRVGRLSLLESSVLVVVSSPHRPEAFEAGRFCIDALKVAVPIWKQEEWSDGTDWGTGARDIGSVPRP